jgi:hypothetical protein
MHLFYIRTNQVTSQHPNLSVLRAVAKAKAKLEENFGL